MTDRGFKVILIKPSHYDDDGYVIQWRRSTIPSNSLASVYGLIAECAEARVLGPEVEITIEAYDECNTVIDVAAAVARIRATGGGFVGLVGVQSNQYPRALDLGRQFRQAGVAVVMGGFHVSGCLSMLPKMPPELAEAQQLGITLFAGEAEGGRMAGLLRDLDRGAVQPVYNFLNDLPDLNSATFPILPPAAIVSRVAGHYTSFDAGRGCPFQCSFCTIINVQGRKSRYRSADDVEAIVRANNARAITRFFVTDDNFARNKNWEAILDRLIALRAEGLKIRLILQVDTLCHRTPRFIEKCAQAGCSTVFIGLENINPQSLMGAKKRQNKIWEYREMLQAWKRVRVITWAGYILGFPTDTPASITRDIEIIKRELPVDILEFFFLTPLPGSEDHKILHDVRRRDGPGSQQVRSGALHHRSCQDDQSGVEGDLPRLLADLLHGRPCRNHPAPRGRHGLKPAEGPLMRWSASPGRCGSKASIRCNSVSSAAESTPSAAASCHSRTQCCSIRACGSRVV